MSLQVGLLACTAPPVPYPVAVSFCPLTGTNITIWKMSRDFVLRDEGAGEWNQGTVQGPYAHRLAQLSCASLVLPQVLEWQFLPCGYGEPP